MRLAVRVVALAALWAASSCGGDSGPAPMVAPLAVSSVSVTPPVQTVTVGQSATFTATLYDANGAVLTGRAVSWSSGLPALAPVSPSGVVSAISVGTVTITAAAEGKSGTAVIVVQSPVVATLIIDSIQPRLFVGRTAQLSFKVLDANGQPVTGPVPTWVSGAPGIVSISSSGMLTGVSAGSTMIAGTLDGKGATRIITAVAIPPAVVSVQPDAATLPRGVDYPLSARVADIDGNPLTGHRLTYQSSDASVATVSSQGVIHTLANGSVNIVATVDGTEQAISRLTVVDPRTVFGVVITADGARPTNLVFVARFGLTASAVRFVAQIDSLTGAFALVMPTFTGSGPSIEYFVDIASGTTRAYHPSYVKLAGGAAPTTPRILLIPHTVVPDSGTYAGRVFPVDLDEAFTPVCTTTSDANCQSYWPSYWITGIKHWSDASRPIPLAFDRTPGTVAAADSMALWAAIRGMEADLGRALFRPAIFTAYTTTGYTSGQVLVSRDATVAPFVGYTNWSWDGQGVVYQARVRLASAVYFGNMSTVSHEFTHALGFSHTCRWSTVMGGYGCAQQARLTPNDVAYYHLAEMVRRQSRTLLPTWSINEALQGDRVLERGMASANAIPMGLRALLTRIEQPGSDGAP